MDELIERLRQLLRKIGAEEEVRPGTRESSVLTSRDWTRLHGMHDLLLAMEERGQAIRNEEMRSVSREEFEVRMAGLWERA